MRSHYTTLITSEDGLVTLAIGERVIIILRGINHVTTLLERRRYRCLSISVERLDELVVRTIKKESQRTSTRSSVVYHFGNQTLVIAEIEFVADADLAGRIDQHIPEADIGIEFSQQEHLDASTRLFLVAIKSGRENLGVVEQHEVLLIKIINEILEHLVFDVATLLVEYHHPALVAMLTWLQGKALFGELEFELA